MYNYIDFSQFRPDEFLVYLRKSRSDDLPVTGVDNNFSKSIISISGIVSEYVEK